MADKLQYVDIPMGTGSGFNSLQSLGNFPITDLQLADTVTFQNSTVAKEPGTVKINNVPIAGILGLGLGPLGEGYLGEGSDLSGYLTNIIGLWDFWPSPTVQVPILATGDGRIVSYGATGIIDTLASGLSGLVLVTFCTALGGSSVRKLFCFTGSDTPLVTSDGVTMTAMSKPAFDWTGATQPIAGVMHNNRMYCFGNSNQPHRMYYSTLGDQEDFQTPSGVDPAGSLNIYPGEGQRIIGACDFANILYIFKYPAGIYWVDDSSTDMTQWAVHKLNTSIGMAGPLAGAQVDNDFVFLTPAGTLSSLMAVQLYGLAASVQTASILPTNLMTYMQQNLQTNYIYNAVATYYAYKRELHLAFAQSGFSYNNRRLVLDLRNPSSPMLRISSRDICNALTTMIDSSGVPKPIIGDNVGFVRMLDQSNFSNDGNAYVGKFQTANVPLIEGGMRRANLVGVEITFQPTGPYTLYMDVYLDGNYKYTVSFSMAGSVAGAALDSFILGTSVLGGGGGTVNATKRLMGDCRRISFIGYNSDVDGSFSISNIRVYFTLGSMRL